MVYTGLRRVPNMLISSSSCSRCADFEDPAAGAGTRTIRTVLNSGRNFPLWRFRGFWNPVRAIRRCVTLVVLKSSEFEEYSEICAIRIWTETLISEFGEDLDSGEISRLHLR